jgi:uncharacterized protein
MILSRSSLPAAIVAVGVALGGFFIGNGFVRAKAADRYVTVKGVAEREVRADLAIWPLHLVGADNDLAAANAKLSKSVDGVRDFLARHGIDTTQIQMSEFSAIDALTNENDANRRPTNRYLVRQTMMVRSNRPDEVLAASQRISELAAVGVVISSGSDYGPGAGGPTFVFSGLNKLKPDMIADATARAREAATQFAHDSHSALGGIRQGNQGVFEILPRDQAPGINESSQIAKVVRVVATIDYYLR